VCEKKYGSCFSNGKEPMRRGKWMMQEKEGENF
jgi:hypothetical protein